MSKYIPGHGLYVSTDQQRPVAELRISASNFGSRPRLQKNNTEDSLHYKYLVELEFFVKLFHVFLLLLMAV